MRSLFLTGASGFVGRHVLRALDPDRFERVTLLGRSEVTLPDRLAASDRVQRIRGGLGRPERYASALGAGTAILHLAGRTGTASPKDYRLDNVEGTRSLLEAAEGQGVAGLVHVSTIAVHFPETAHYPYADSKREAETLVRAARVPWTIVRPAIVLGRDSPNWRKLAGIARAPVLVVPGSGAARIQPIHVDDLASVLLDLASDGAFDREAHDLGGRDALTMEEFLRRAHRRFHGRRGLALRAPIRFGLPILRAAERFSPLPLPVTEGRLSSFLYDGVSERGNLQARVADRVRGVEAILDDIVGNGGRSRR